MLHSYTYTHTHHMYNIHMRILYTSKYEEFKKKSEENPRGIRFNSGHLCLKR